MQTYSYIQPQQRQWDIESLLDSPLPRDLSPDTLENPLTRERYYNHEDKSVSEDKSEKYLDAETLNKIAYEKQKALTKKRLRQYYIERRMQEHAINPEDYLVGYSDKKRKNTITQTVNQDQNSRKENQEERDFAVKLYFQRQEYMREFCEKRQQYRALREIERNFEHHFNK